MLPTHPALPHSLRETWLRHAATAAATHDAHAAAIATMGRDAHDREVSSRSYSRPLCVCAAEIDSKCAETEAGNLKLEAENQTLSEYIDVLMAQIAGMGKSIAPPRRGGSGSWFSSFGRKKVIQLNDHAGELQSKPTPRTPTTKR